MITLRPLIKGRDIRMACRPSIIHRLAHSYKGTVHTAPTHKCTHIVHSGTRTCAQSMLHALTLHSVSSLLLVSCIVCCRLVSVWFLREVSASATYVQHSSAHTAHHTNKSTLNQGPHTPYMYTDNQSSNNKLKGSLPSF